jgi:predicted RNA binding protein YcfA (HicA-like mRNA interferase family)
MRLPRGLDARRVVAALRRHGFEFVRQTGGHITLHHPARRRTVTVPAHGEFGPGLLASILRQSGLSREQFTDAL